MGDTGERILVVDDDPGSRDACGRSLAARGYRVLGAGSAPEALHVLDETPVDLVLAFARAPGAAFADLVRHVREDLRDSEILVLGRDGDDVVAAARRSLDRLHARRASRTGAARRVPRPCGLVGESAAMRAVFDAIVAAAGTDAPVLVAGECGTGRELVARAIHYSSRRAPAPFVQVSCVALPETLQEGELFGYPKGAAKAPADDRGGRFREASGGTVYLDEIAETRAATQARLARELRGEGVDRDGPRPRDARLVASTDRDLGTLAGAGMFNAELWRRLEPGVIALPPLRERGDDVLILASRFAARSARERRKAEPRFTDAALDALQAYPWPGNVRELEALVRRLVAASENGVVDAPDLPPHVRGVAARGCAVERTLAEVEAEHIRRVMEHVGGNKSRAAKVLGIDRKTLREKVRGKVDS
jgi:DNA-binding NtrC family response regulator